jgi:hypothetical protein
VEQIEKANHHETDPSPKLYKKKSKSMSPILQAEPKPDYTGNIIPIFHHQNHMASKFANFKSSKLYSSSPDNHHSEVAAVENGSGKIYLPHRYSPTSKKSGSNNGGGLRRSESLHTSLASIATSSNSSDKDKRIGAEVKDGKKKRGSKPTNKNNIDKWKSMENLDGGDDNFTLRWRYPVPDFVAKEERLAGGSSPSPNSSPKTKSSPAKPGKTSKDSNNGVLELFNDYRQSRFSKNSNSKQNSSASGGNGNQTMSIFSRYSKKSNPASSASTQPVLTKGNHNEVQRQEKDGNGKDKDIMSSMTMFSLPPIFVTQGMDITNHRISDLPSGLY